MAELFSQVLEVVPLHQQRAVPTLVFALRRVKLNSLLLFLVCKVAHSLGCLNAKLKKHGKICQKQSVLKRVLVLRQL